MKKTMILLCALMLLTAPFAARAEEYAGLLLAAPDAESMLDWAVYPLDAHNVIVYSWPLDLDNIPARWTWYRNGKIQRDLAFMAWGPQGNWCDARFFLTEDGQIKALIPTYLGNSGAVMNAGGDEYPIARWEALDWTENGFENPAELFTGVREIDVYGSSVLSADCLLDGPRIVYLQNAAGAEIWRCLLSGGETIKNVFGITANPDGVLTLYGTAVARSRGIYTAFAVTVNQQMEIVTQDVRDLIPDYEDDSPRVLLAPDGSPLGIHPGPVPLAQSPRPHSL